MIRLDWDRGGSGLSDSRNILEWTTPMQWSSALEPLPLAERLVRSECLDPCLAPRQGFLAFENEQPIS